VATSGATGPPMGEAGGRFFSGAECAAIFAAFDATNSSSRDCIVTGVSPVGLSPGFGDTLRNSSCQALPRRVRVGMELRTVSTVSPNPRRGPAIRGCGDDTPAKFSLALGNSCLGLSRCRRSMDVVEFLRVGGVMERSSEVS